MPAAAWLRVSALAGFALAGAADAEVKAVEQAAYERLFDFPSLVKGGRVAPVWLEDGSGFVYASNAGGRREYFRVDPISGERHPFFDQARLRAALPPSTGVASREQEAQIDDFSFVDSGRAIRFERQGKWFDLNLQDYALRELSVVEAEQIKLRQQQKVTMFHPVAVDDDYEQAGPGGEAFLLCQDNNLWIRHVADNRLVPLTTDGVERFGWCNNWNDPRATWAPDGNTVAAFKEDARLVHYTPVVHWLGREETITHHQHAQAGGILQSRTLHFIDVLSGEQKAIPSGDDAAYFRSLGWHPNGREFLYFWLSRDGKRIELRAADRFSGQARVLWHEESKTFVTATMEFPYKPIFHMLSDGRFIVSSERTGWQHLYLYEDRVGKAGEATLLRPLSHGEFPVLSLQRVDEKKGLAYFGAHSDPKRLYDTHLMRVGLDGKGQIRLTEETGEHWINFSPSGDYFLDTHFTVARPPQTEWRKADGRLVAVLEKADVSALSQLGWQAPEEFVVKAADGRTDLYGALYKPVNFDPSRRYPVVEYIYGGAQAVNTPRTFVPYDPRARFAYALTACGFIVAFVDGRGTPERGKAFQDVVYGNWGRYEIADHAAALRAAAQTRPYMDMNRVGVFGISYGGYFTTRALLQAPDLYKVGVSSAQVVRLDTLNAGAIENYMGGRPQDVPAPYEYASNMRLLDHLEGKLLIMHPTSDVNAPFAHAMQLVDGLTRLGKPYDLMVLPEGNHVFEYRDSSEGFGFWISRIRDYLVENLHP